MPNRTDPVLSLALGNISKIDKVDCDRLSSLWTVFSKCAENLENGRRLENLSWRLWYRECQLLDRERTVETLETNPESSVGRRVKRQNTSSLKDLPPLSTSVESVISEDEVEEDSDPSARPDLHRMNSKDQHLTPYRFHELVTRFGQEQPQYGQWKDRNGPHVDVTLSDLHEESDVFESTAPIDHNLRDEKFQDAHAHDGLATASPAQSDATLAVVDDSVHASRAGEHISGQIRRASSVVHGFNPSCVSVKKSPVFEPSVLGNSSNGRNMFFIESSPSDSDSDSDELSSSKSRKKKLTLRQPSLVLKTSVSPVKPPVKKHTSFREIVDEGSEYDSSPFDSDEESGDDVGPACDKGDSAIMSDDEDEEVEGEDDEWDSICSESRPPSPSNGHLFDKVEDIQNRPALTSRKSILSTLLTNPMTRLSNAQSKSSPAIAQSRVVSPIASPHEPKFNLPGGITDLDITVGKTLPTSIKGSVSPRTTRRNMLATELSESLRRHLLWERKQKSSTNIQAAAQAVLQRRHTVYDLTKAQQYPTTSSSTEAAKKAELETPTENEFGYNGAGW